MLALLGGLSALAVVRGRHEALFQEARADLLAGRGRRALAGFDALLGSHFVGPRAADGAALARALLGEAGKPPTPSPDLDPFPAEALLAVARREATGPVAARRRIALILEARGERLAALDLAALELDAGDDAAARRRVKADPLAFVARGLGLEILAVLERREAGAVSIVRDRAGRRLGVLDAAGTLALEPTVAPTLVPEALRAALSARVREGQMDPGVRVGLDLDLSALAQESLGFVRGSIVLVEPHRGTVLAAVSDAVTRAARPGGTPAFEDRREPASVAKIITAAAGLRAGLDLDAFLRRLECTGPERFGHGVLWCSYPAGRLQGLDQAMAVSCNMAFAHIGVEVGREAVLAELRRWGFDHDFLVAPAGRIVAPSGDLRQLADLSIGLEATDITPLHGALLATVLANEGRMPEPALLEGTEGPLGLVTNALPLASPRDVVSPETIPVLAHSMQAVAVYGTAAGVAPPGFPVAMKTGTGAEWRKGYHANYVGVAPWPNPQVAFCVRITHEPTSPRVSRTARDVLRVLLEGLKARQTRAAASGIGVTRP